VNEAAKQVEQAKPGGRSLLIDLVRGMAISLVALGHTNQGILHRGWWGTSSVGARLDITIYSFHMPAFFFVSGIFLCASLEKRGPRRFTLERARTLLWPYVLWSLLSHASVGPLSHFVVQHPISWTTFWIQMLLGYGIWFLPALFVCQMFGMVLRRLHGGLIVALAVLAYYLVPETGVNWLNMAVLFFPFVAAGMWLGRGYEGFEKMPRRFAIAGSVALLALLLVDTWNFFWMGYKNNILLAGTIGTLMLILIARSLGGSRVARAFAWAGEASLAIYLAGEYGQGLVRQLMMWAHLTAPYPQLILPTLAAIAIPAWIYQHRVRLHIEWLFIAPFWKPRPRSIANG
jgi:fucose 4-O-acetylase-like acetyltransferase